MSLATIRPYFKARMKELGLQEWKNPFDFSNIPETIIGSAYNCALGPASQHKFNQQSLDLIVPVNLRLFAKAYKEHMVAYDSAVSLAQDALEEIMDPQNRLTQAAMKTVNLGSMNLEAYSPTNDNIIVVNFVFNVTISLQVCS